MRLLHKLFKLKRFVLFAFFMLAGVHSKAQLDSTHWIPPLHTRTEPGPQYLYLSTPSIDSIEVFLSSGTGEPILDCNGELLTSVFVSNSDPVVVCFRNVDSTQVLIPRGELHQTLQNRGISLRSDSLFYANIRVRSNNQLQAGSLTAKGSFGKGKIFRTGHLWSNNDPTGNKCHFVSIMATEDNTRIKFSDYDPLILFENWMGPLPEVNLNKGECYVTSVYLNATTPANDNAYMGMLVESDKDIIINSGSWDGSPNANIRDIGIDQITPIQIVGKEYILVRGQGPSTIEYPTVVAHYDNTEVYLSGQPVPYAVIDAGEFVVIPDSEYSPDQNLYIRATKDIYVFQMMGGTGIAQTVGMNFIPPLSCLGQSYVDNIPFIGEIGPWLYNGGLFIVARVSSNVMINDLPPSVPASPVPGNPDYVTYKIVTGLSGNVKVTSERPIQVGLFGFNGAAGYGGYYSGFEVVSIDLDLTADPCLDTIQSYGINIDSIIWLRNGEIVPGQNESKIRVLQEGKYQVVGLNKGCLEEPDTSREIEIFLPDSVFLFSQTCQPSEELDTIIFTKNIHGCDSIVHQIVSLLPSSRDTLREEICEGESFLFAGAAYSQSGMYADSNANQFGCDSVIWLDLVVRPEQSITVAEEICEGDSLLFSGSYFHEKGIHEVSFQNQFGCDSIMTLDLKVNPVHQFTFSERICEGDSLLFSGKYYSDSGRYQLKFQNQFGCDSLVDLQLRLDPLPNPVINGIEPYCKGDSIQLSVGTFSEYFWSNGSDGQAVWISGEDQISVEVENEFGCIASTQADIPAPIELDADFTAQDVLCYGDRNGAIVVEGIYGGLGTYLVSVNGSVVPDRIIDNLDLGLYNIRIEDSIGCAFDTAITIFGPMEPLWLNLGPDLSINYGESATIVASTNSQQIKELNWYIQDGLICQFCFQDDFVITEDTWVRVVLIDENGCETFDEVFLKVLKEKKYFVPNAFTPNDDGVNDRFTIFGNSFVESIEVLEIYDRWGNLLFHSENLPLNNTSYGWDGTFNGKLLTPAVFVYRAVLRYRDGTKEYLAGDVTLLK